MLFSHPLLPLCETSHNEGRILFMTAGGFPFGFVVCRFCTGNCFSFNIMEVFFHAKK